MFLFDAMFVIVPLFMIVVMVVMVCTIIKRAKNPQQSIMNNLTSDQNIEQMEKMATVMGKVAADMAKEMNPEYKSLKCPNCGAALTDDVEECEYCNAPLTKVVATNKGK